MKPKIAITMGDPASVGPEICLHLLQHAPTLELCQPIIFGDLSVLNACAQKTGLPAPSPENVLDLGAIDAKKVVPGVVNAQTGAASFAYIERAISEALAGQIQGVCTAPINKEAIHAAGVPFPGHTEIFTTLTKAPRGCMLLTSAELSCSFVTTHIGYRDVPGKLSIDRILDVIELTHEAMSRLRGRPAKLVACGLNPHAGENGIFGGGEEEIFIAPALEKARERGIEIEGPIPPDTAFLTKRRAQTDAFICMYHDQGHIPLKMLAFDSAINVTLGLPIIRTSVDHGTALDIAWQGKANPNSLYEAAQLAARLAG